MTTRDALNSTLLLALARIGVPILLGVNLAVAGYWLDLIYDRQELAFMKINSLTVTVDGAHAARLTEIERRLNSRKSPISATSDGYSIQAVP